MMVFVNKFQLPLVCFRDSPALPAGAFEMHPVHFSAPSESLLQKIKEKNPTQGWIFFFGSEAGIRTLDQ